MLPALAVAAPLETTAPLGGANQFRLLTPDLMPSIPEGGTMRIDATAKIPAATEYLELRLRVFRPSGGLLHQKTEIRHETTDTVAFTFSRPLTGLDMDAGRYPFELQMRATGSQPIKLEGDIFVYDPKAQPLRVVLLTRFASSPGIDPQGRFVLDPGLYTRSRDQLFALDSLLAATPRLRLSASLPPMLLDEWDRIAGGYQMASPEGLESIGADQATPRSYASALDAVRSMTTSGRAELLDVPYAEPDVVGLQAIGGLSDLALHYREGVSSYVRSVAATPSPVTTLTPGRMPAGALPLLRRARLRGALLDPTSVRAKQGAASSGLYDVGQNFRVLTWDNEMSRSLATGETRRLLAGLFEHRSEDASTPVTLVLDVGAGAPTDLVTVAPALRHLAGSPWIRFVTASKALSGRAKRATLQTQFSDRKPPAEGYWREVSQARRAMLALQAAAGADDRVAAQVRSAVLLAESRCWAGPDLSWSLADRGRSFSATAIRVSGEFFNKVTIEGQDLTLSGALGEIPLNVRNGTGRELRVELVASSRFARFPKGDHRFLRLRKAENFLTLPIDLGSVLADRVDVTLVADGKVVATEHIQVRASYLDRVALVGMVAAALGAMLFFIRKRVRAADDENRPDAGTIRQR